jgi:large subunit ribosomal protein L6
MSRIGIQPVTIPDGVSVTIGQGVVTAKGPKGENSLSVPESLSVEQGELGISVSRRSEEKTVRALHGTIRSLLSNLVEGVSKGFERHLVIEGVGYRAALQGSELVLSLGFSHPIHYQVPEGIEVKVDGQNAVGVSGIDKQQVGLVAARIRSFSPVEPYKGKGVRYRDEQVRRKVGKAVA